MMSGMFFVVVRLLSLLFDCFFSETGEIWGFGSFSKVEHRGKFDHKMELQEFLCPFLFHLNKVFLQFHEHFTRCLEVEIWLR